MKTIKTDYDAYEFVVNKLLKQNSKSVNENGDCRYRGYSDDQIEKFADEAYLRAEESLGLKDTSESEAYVKISSLASEIIDDIVASNPPNLACAAGHLIDDIHYHQNLEGKTLAPSLSTDHCPVAEVIQKSHPEWNYTSDSHEMVRNLQAIHDHAEPEAWEKYFSSAEFNSDGSFVGGLYNG